MRIIQHGDVMTLQRASRQFRVGVVIVITEHSPNPFGGTQRSESFGAGLDVTPIRSTVIAGEDKHVGPCSLRETDHPAHYIQAKNPTVMNVGQLRDAK